MITIKEVAELAQVSQSTVSRTLNDHPTVKDKNRQKVYEAIEQLGYKPNAFAQALASSRSNSIGMVVGSLDGPFFGPLMHQVENTVREKNLHLILTSGHQNKEKEADAIRFLQSKQVDGLIINSDKLEDDRLIELVQENPATIIVNRYIEAIAKHCVFIDNELGGYIATEHLLKSGHRKVACITGPKDNLDSQNRLLGYQKALADYHLAFDERLVVEGRFDHHGNYDVANNLLSNNPDITAVFCHNDNIALSVYDVCGLHNLKVGDDISVVGFDNDIYSEYLRPKLTTVNFPNREMGLEAAKRVIALLSKSDHTMDNALMPSLIERHSVKAFN